MILLWAGLAYVLNCFDELPPRGLPASLLCIALLATLAFLPWHFSRRRSLARKNTFICQRCNRVKSADGQPVCSCGGRFFTLADMKWVPPLPARPDSASGARPALTVARNSA